MRALWRGLGPPSRSICIKAPSVTNAIKCAHHSTLRTPLESFGINNHDQLDYTSGRWLWDEKLQLGSRTQFIDIERLKSIAAKAVGARHCVSFTKVYEDLDRKEFALKMDNGKTLIAKLPDSLPWHRKLDVGSEVATMDFAREVLEIPVPKVLAWSASGIDEHNIGARYIITEEPRGKRLFEIWNQLNIHEQDAIVQDLVDVQSRLLSVSFSHYGALRYRPDDSDKYTPAKVSGYLHADTQKAVEDRYILHECHARDEGALPWTTADGCLAAMLWRQNLLNNGPRGYNGHPLWNLDTGRSYFKGPGMLQSDREANREVLQKLHRLAPWISFADHPDNAPTLWHNNLNRSNIFVQDGRISDIIGWQHTFAMPLRPYAKLPDLVAYDGERMLTAPDNFDEIQDVAEKERIVDTVEKSLVLYFYSQSTGKENPTLAKWFSSPVYDLLQGLTTMLEDETCSPATLHMRLFKVWQNWDKISPNVQCPIQFTKKEIKGIQKEMVKESENDEFWNVVSPLVSRTGHVMNEDFDKALSMFQEMRAQGRRELKGKELEDYEKSFEWLDQPIGKE